MITATYPGTFDPLTNGHLDLIRRACWIFRSSLLQLPKAKENTRSLLWKNGYKWPKNPSKVSRTLK